MLYIYFVANNFKLPKIETHSLKNFELHSSLWGSLNYQSFVIFSIRIKSFLFKWLKLSISLHNLFSMDHKENEVCTSSDTSQNSYNKIMQILLFKTTRTINRNQRTNCSLIMYNIITRNNPNFLNSHTLNEWRCQWEKVIIHKESILACKINIFVN